jgi:hypothetical protein
MRSNKKRPTGKGAGPVWTGGHGMKLAEHGPTCKPWGTIALVVASQPGTDRPNVPTRFPIGEPPKRTVDNDHLVFLYSSVYQWYILEF